MMNSNYDITNLYNPGYIHIYNVYNRVAGNSPVYMYPVPLYIYYPHTERFLLQSTSLPYFGAGNCNSNSLIIIKIREYDT